jgi:hypothetical protein
MNLGAWGAILLLALIPWSAQTSPQASAPAPDQSSATLPPAPPNSGPVQPIPFNHKQHAGTLKLPCEFCHVSSRSGETVAIPQAAMCMNCHQTMDTSDPGVQKLAAYAKSDSTIAWIRIYQLPSFVTFSHKTHLTHGITCQQCHGDVSQQVRLYKVTDISMASCMQCHQATKASISCDTCHQFQQ